MTTPNNAAALECVLDEMGAFIEQEESPNLDTLENWHQRLRATLTQPDALTLWNPYEMLRLARRMVADSTDAGDLLALSRIDECIGEESKATLTSQPSGEDVRDEPLWLQFLRKSLVYEEDAVSFYLSREQVEYLLPAHPSADAPGVNSSLRVASLALADLAERNTDDLDLWQAAIAAVRNAADAPGVAVDGAWTLTEIRNAWNKAGEVGEPRSWFDLSAALHAALAPKPEGGHG